MNPLPTSDPQPSTTRPQSPRPTAAYLREQLASLARSEQVNRQARPQLEQALNHAERRERLARHHARP